MPMKSIFKPLSCWNYLMFPVLTEDCGLLLIFLWVYSQMNKRLLYSILDYWGTLCTTTNWRPCGQSPSDCWVLSRPPMQSSSITCSWSTPLQINYPSDVQLCTIWLTCYVAKWEFPGTHAHVTWSCLLSSWLSTACGFLLKVLCGFSSFCQSCSDQAELRLSKQGLLQITFLVWIF